jgi:hypothetical protein
LSRTAWRRGLWAAAAVWAAAILVGGAIPRGAGVPLPTGGVDKPLHLLAYAGLAALLCGALRAGRRRRWAAAGLSLALASAYGILDEGRQAFVPGRVASGLDLVADVLGALLGAGAAGLLPTPWPPDEAEPTSNDDGADPRGETQDPADQ